MKVIRVPMEDKPLAAANRRAKTRNATRAALIKGACEEYLRRSEEELDRRYVEGYRRKPEDPAWGKAGARLAAKVWSKEQW